MRGEAATGSATVPDTVSATVPDTVSATATDTDTGSGEDEGDGEYCKIPAKRSVGGIDKVRLELYPLAAPRFERFGSHKGETQHQFALLIPWEMVSLDR